MTPVLILLAAAATAQSFTLVPQSGHTTTVNSIALSEDEQTLVTAATEGLIKYWDLRSGKEVRTIVHSRSLSTDQVLLGPGDRTLLTAHSSGPLEERDASTNTVLRSFPGGGPILAQSRDRQLIAYAGTTVEVVDLKAGKKIASLTPKLDCSSTNGRCFVARFLEFSEDAQTLLLASDNGTLVWKWKSDATPVLMKDLKEVRGASVSADGRFVAAASQNGGIGVWKADTGDRTQWLVAPKKDETHYGVLFLPDGKSLAVGNAGTLEIYDVPSFKLRQSRVLGTDISEKIKQIVYAPKSQQLLLTDLMTGFIRILRWPDLVETNRLASALSSIRDVVFSPTGHRLAVGITAKGSLLPMYALWNLDSLRVEQTFDAVDLAFSPDGATLAIQNREGIRLLDAATFKVKHFLPRTKPASFSDMKTTRTMSFSHDGRRLVRVSGDNIFLYDIEEGKLLKSVSNKGFDWQPHFLPGDKQILVLAECDQSGEATRVIDAQTLDPISGYQAGERTCAHFSRTALSPDGKRIITFDNGSKAAIQTALTGKLEKDLSCPAEPEDLRGGNSEVMWDPLDRFFATVGTNTVLGWLIDPKTGRTTGRLRGHTSATTSVAVSADGRLVAVGAFDGTVRLWPLGAKAPFGDLGGEKSVVLLQSPDRWFAYTDDGYFDASNNGSSLVGVASGLRGYAVDQFALRSNRPDLILERLGIGDAEMKEHFKQRYLRRLQKAGIEESALLAGIHVPEAQIVAATNTDEAVTLNLRFSDASVALKRYNVFVNDVPLYGSEGKPLTGKNATATEIVPITAGMNKIEVSSINVAGAESFRALHLAASGKKDDPELYYLGFGVSKYKDSTLTLEFAHKDALDLQKAFASMSPAFSTVHVKTWTNEEVTPEAITAAKAELLKARPQDVVVLFIAGHGMHADNAEARYYYLTYGTDLSQIEKTAAPFELIEDLLQGIPPRRKLFLMDTCESGERDDAVEQKLFAQSEGTTFKARAVRGLKRQQKSAAPPKARGYLLQPDRFIYNDLQRRSGAIVFSSSRGGEFSFESATVGNGYFTSEILAALKGAADADKNSRVSVDELRSFVSKQVAEKTNNQQHPTVDRDNLSQKFDFPGK